MSLAEVLVIALVALIVIGPKQLPTVAHHCGRYYQLLRNGYQQIRNQFNDQLKQEQLKENIRKAEEVEKVTD